MFIDATTLESMYDYKGFQNVFLRHVEETTKKPVFEAELSYKRLTDAHYAWLEDLSRVRNHESKLIEGLDHFKQCAHLAYWLRRMAPVIEIHNRATEIEGDDGFADEKLLGDMLFKYGTEYLAFDLGVQICYFYEKNRTDRTTQFSPPRPSLNYLIDVCHMMKFKHVSPHSMYLIYKSLLLGR